MILQTGADWLYVYPKGFHKLLVHIKDKYNNPPIYVTENGKSVIFRSVANIRQIMTPSHTSYLRCKILTHTLSLTIYHKLQEFVEITEGLDHMICSG